MACGSPPCPPHSLVVFILIAQAGCWSTIYLLFFSFVINQQFEGDTFKTMQVSYLSSNCPLDFAVIEGSCSPSTYYDVWKGGLSNPSPSPCLSVGRKHSSTSKTLSPPHMVIDLPTCFLSEFRNSKFSQSWAMWAYPIVFDCVLNIVQWMLYGWVFRFCCFYFKELGNLFW